MGTDGTSIRTLPHRIGRGRRNALRGHPTPRRGRSSITTLRNRSGNRPERDVPSRALGIGSRYSRCRRTIPTRLRLLAHRDAFDRDTPGRYTRYPRLTLHRGVPVRHLVRDQIGRAYYVTSVTCPSRMPSFTCKKKL